MTFSRALTLPQSSRLFLFCCLAGLASAAGAQVRLGSVFGDHMVLASGVPVSIWGSGCPGGDTLKLSVAGQSVITHSDWQGNWEVKLAPMKPGGPYQMNIQIGGSGPLVVSSAATDHGGAEINDVMIGKVVTMQAITQQNPGATPTPSPAGTHPYAQVRVFRPGESVETTYSGHAAAQWTYVAQDVLPPQTAAYFQAGHELHEKLHIPVGVVVISRGPGCLPTRDCNAQAPIASSDRHP